MSSSVRSTRTHEGFLHRSSTSTPRNSSLLTGSRRTSSRPPLVADSTRAAHTCRMYAERRPRSGWNIGRATSRCATSGGISCDGADSRGRGPRQVFSREDSGRPAARRPATSGGARRGGRLILPEAWRDFWGCGRERVRQNDAWPDDPPARGAFRRPHRIRRGRHHSYERIGTPPDSTLDADHFPRPPRGAQPRDDDRREHRGPPSHPRTRHGARGEGAGAGDHDGGGPLARGTAVHQVPRGREWGAEAAGRDCTCDDPPTEADRRGRARRDARHVDPRENPRTDARTEGEVRTHIHLYHPRPPHREIHLRSNRDHVSGPNRGGRRFEGDLPRAQAPVHPSAPGGHPGPGSGPASNEDIAEG